MSLNRAAARRLVLSLLAVALVVTAGLTARPGGAQGRRVVVVGDSIVLGAEANMVGAFQGAGWGITFDAAVSRSTLAAVDAVEAHRAELTDSLVLSFGANDGGSPGAFRDRVQRVLAATAGVPHVYWLTIREVRDYYPAANQVIRDVAASFPNVTVIDWHAASAGVEGLTASDGLHLTGAGAARLTEVVTGVVVNGQAPPPPPPPPPPPTTLPPTTLPPPPPPTTVAPTTLAPTTAAPTTTAASTTTTTEVARRTSDEVAAVEMVVDSESADLGDVAGWTVAGGLLLMLLLLGAGGLGLGVWSLASTGGRPPPDAMGASDTIAVRTDPSPNHPAVRAQQRAERIAAATAAAGAAVPGELEGDAATGQSSVESTQQS